MKNKIQILVVALLIQFSAMYAENSNINEVTVYKDRALVTRSKTINTVEGEKIIVFEGLTNRLDPKSLRAKVNGKGVELLGINWEKIIVNKIQNSKLNALELERIALENAIRELKDKKTVLTVKLKFVKEYRTFSKKTISEQATKKVTDESSEKWNNSIKFLDESEEVVIEKIHNLNIEIRKIEKKLTATKSNLNKYINPESRTTITAFVAIKSAKSAKCDIKLSYVTYGAGWTPRYDARIDPDTSKLNLTYYATVTQQSGEIWDGVQLYLSTAQPQVGAKAPKLPRFVLDGSFATRNKNIKYEMLKGDKVGSAAPQEEFEVSAPEVAEDEMSISRSSVEDKGTSVTFKIKDAVKIYPDGRPYQVTVNDSILQTKLSYEAIPVEKAYIYLKASSHNKTPYPLLSGPVAIFRGGGYIGTSKISYTPPNSPINLFAGIDENISIKRVKKDGFYNKKSLLGGTKTDMFHWKIVIKNNKEKSTKIKLLEGIPVSQLEEVQVKIQPETTKGYNFNNQKGILTWNITLKAHEQKEIFLKYTIIKDN